MVKRVSIHGGQNAAMTVSLPGYDVDTATIDQTCFDSRWSGYTPFATGQIFSQNNSVATFGFAEVLDQPPLCLSHVMTYFNGVPQTVFENTPMMFRGNGTDQWWYVAVGNSSLAFQANFNNRVCRLTFTLFKRTSG